MNETATLPQSRWRSTTEIAAIYGKDRDTVWKWISEGLETPVGRLRLQARKLGREWGIEVENVETFFDALEGDEKALAIALSWKFNRELKREPVSETPAAADARARRDQAKARKALGRK